MGIRVKEVKMEGVKKFAMHLPWDAPLLKLEICETGETFYLVQVE